MADCLTEYNLTSSQAAKLLGVELRTLMRWRKKGFGPSAIRFGMRNHKYSRAEILIWLESYNKWKRVQ